jgi:hypothetical protein
VSRNLPPRRRDHDRPAGARRRRRPLGRRAIDALADVRWRRRITPRPDIWREACRERRRGRDRRRPGRQRRGSTSTGGVRRRDGSSALAVAAQTSQPFFDADLHWLDGDLLLATCDAADEAAVRYHRALAIAREQGARSLELRAATSLARLWQRQGKRAEARGLLAPVYAWFKDGFDTGDLLEAKALLDELT